MATNKKMPYVKIKGYVETSMWAYNVETEVKEGRLC